MAQVPVPVGSELQSTPSLRVHSTTRNWPSMRTGDFVVAWASQSAGPITSIIGKRFTSAGVQLATEFQVNVYTSANRGAPDLANRLREWLRRHLERSARWGQLRHLREAVQLRRIVR